MERDYGLKDIENKLEAIYSAFKNRKTVWLTESDDYSEDADMKFKLFAYSDSHAEATLSYLVQNTSSNTCAVKVNGAQKAVYKSIIGQNSHEFDLNLTAGSNEVTLSFSDVANVSDVVLKVCGALDKPDYSSRISSLDLSSGNVTALYNGAKKSVVIYGDDGTTKMIIFYGSHTVFAMTRFSTNSFIMVYGDGENMNGRVCGVDGFVISSFSFAADATSFCGGYSPDGALFYAVEKGRVKKYRFDSGLNLTVTDTGFTGKEAFASAESSDLIVIGYDGRAKLVVG